MPKFPKPAEFTTHLHLHDCGIDELKQMTIKVTGNMILIRPEGYGDFCSTDGNGWPISIEWYEGNPRVIVWDNINEEDLTHIITLEGSHESRREDESK